MIFLQEQLKSEIIAAVAGVYEIDPAEIIFTLPPNRKFGDLSTTVPFLLAKKHKEKPFVIGQKIVEKMKGQLDWVADIQLAGGGFLNFFLDREKFLGYLCKIAPRKLPRKNRKVIVEHTSINPNKAAHIGHLRNSCLGDTLVKSLDFLGFDVEVQNYIDDTGIQVADVVWGLLHQQKKDLAEIRRIPDLASVLWELYPQVSRLMEEHPEYKEERNDVHKKIENKVEPEFSVCQYVSQEVLRDHIRVMNNLGIYYDLLVKESDIIEFDFFRDAADIMKKKNIMYLSQDSEKKGCWVILYKKENVEKIIIRSNDTIVYIGKDLAYTFWKTGLFSRNFQYQKFFAYPDGREIYITSRHKQGEKSGKDDFGNAGQVYNVIDVRQSYPQNVISQVLDDLELGKMNKLFTHFSYEMVALTPRCVQEMGFSLSEEEMKKPYVEVSGRKGIAVKADDLIRKLIEKSTQEVKRRNPDFTDERARELAGAIATGALRYFLIKFNANSVIAFDFQDALAFEGDTGPYLQYALVRINSILKKLKTTDVSSSQTTPSLACLEQAESEYYFEILLQLSLLETQVEFSIANHELSTVASYANGLCQKFNQYYHLYPVISETDERKKSTRLALILLIKNRLEKIFYVLGIPVPERM